MEKYPQEIQAILSRYPAERKRSAVMPLLHLAQRESGYVTRQGLQEIGEILEMPVTDIDSLVGFYTLFHEAEGGSPYHVQVCTDLPCALRGADEFLRRLCENIGVRVSETTPDGRVTVEEVKCLAGCHRAPVIQVQGGGEIRYFENQTVESAATLVAELRNRKEAA